MVDGGQPDLVAGRYRIVGTGVAGPGTAVLHGYDERLGRTVALESLRPEWRAYPAARAAYTAAAYRAARFAHHQVLRVLDVASEDGLTYMVSEPARGGTLADRLADGPLAEASARRTGLAVLGALHAAHTSGLLHLDLSPANVVFDEHGTIQVARFGILDALYRAVRDEPGVDPASPGTAGPGTGDPERLVIPAPLARRSPECVAGADPTAAADLWSVGALIYRALTGTFPWAGPRSAPTPLAVARPGTDRRLAAAVDRALDPRPEHRFASADEMAHALAEAVPPRRRPVAPVAAAWAAGAAATGAAADGEPTGLMGQLIRTDRHAAVAAPAPPPAGGTASRWRRASGPGSGSRRTARVAGAGAGAAAAVAAGILAAVLVHPGAGASTGPTAPAASSSAPSTAAAPAAAAPSPTTVATTVPAPPPVAAVTSAVATAPTPAVPPPTPAPATTAAPTTTTTVAPTTTAPPVTTTTVPAAPTTTAPPTTAAPPTTTATTAPAATTTTTAPASSPTTTAPAATTTAAASSGSGSGASAAG